MFHTYSPSILVTNNECRDANVLVPSIIIECWFEAYLITYGVSTLYIVVIICFIFTINCLKNVKVKYTILFRWKTLRNIKLILRNLSCKFKK